MNRRIAALLLLMAAATACTAFRIEIRPLPKNVKKSSDAVTTDPNLVYRFFDEDFVSGGYAYWYPDNSKVFIPEESGKNGEVALQFDLEANDYSGGSVCLYNLLYDLRPYYDRGALQFWIKGAKGGEVAWVALVDDENTDGKKTVVRLPLSNYGPVTKEWTKKTIPLRDLGKRGVFWDAKKRVEIPEPFTWDKVAEFRIEIKKADNPTFTVWADDIFILRDVFDAPATPRDEEYWDERKEILAGAPKSKIPAVQVLHTLFQDDLPPGAFAYVYGGKTAFKIQPTTDKNNAGVLATYQDNADYSGVTIALGAGRNVDISKQRERAAGLAFWAKGAPNVKKIFIGILDDESDGKKVQTKVMLSDFGDLDTTWKYFMIPLKRFAAMGLYWDEQKKAEVGEAMKWHQINEFRFSVNRYENKVPEGEPAVLYVDDVTIIDSIPGYVDPDVFWAAFKSDAPDLPLHDLESETDHNWEKSFGPKSDVQFSFEKIDDTTRFGSAVLAISYKLGDWCDVYYDYPTNNTPAEKRDWTRHWGLKFWFYTDKSYQPVTVQIQDSGNEVFVANAGGPRGWSEVLIPFRKFGKFPYYQPDDAVQNGRLDLDNVRRIDFKPAGEGTVASYKIDNIALTNQRGIVQPKAAEKVTVAVTGDPSKSLTPSINPGIFGINVALWDGDLLKPATVDQVKEVGHGVLRYPGGLRADEDNWQEVLTKKDWMVDTDEFLDFCKSTGTTAMITANFGRGTPKQAADWVKHVNVDGKAKVRLWEVGNELYGDWHANHCTAEEYGKRAAEFIKAMKAVDPTILVGVVWVLDGEWNKTVLQHTKDLADAVIVHHYPQHAGEENDLALLGAPQSLDHILPSVRKQIEESGAPGKKYEIWLTEWNSVDFKPGPQTLSIINALFVADYLGVLARHNIEQASYWDVHNDITPERGDYGYLSRTGAPDGDNVPRPSYWAFRMISEVLRGRLLHCETDNDNTTAYLSRKDGGKSLIIINKHPETAAVVTLKIPGFAGKASVKQLTKASGIKGPAETSQEIKEGTTLTVPAYSVTTLEVR